MGTGNSKTVEEEMQINEDQWKYLQLKNRVQVVKHKFFDIYGEIHFIPSDPLNTYHDELQKYYYRKNQHDALVQVYAVEYMKSNQATMCGNNKNIKVITQHIPYRLHQFPLLVLAEALYVLSESIRGFSVLHQKAGKFIITQNMIGVNSEGHMKVWLNENFATNHPQSEIPLLQMTVKYQSRSLIQNQQRQIITQVLKLVEPKIENGRLPEPIRFKLLNSNNFLEAYSELQKFTQQTDIFIPDRVSIEKIKKNMTTYRSAKDSLVRGDMTQQPHAKYLPNFAYTQLNNHNLNSKFVIRNTYVNPNVNPHKNTSNPLNYSQQSSNEISRQRNSQLQINRPIKPIFQNIRYN